MKTYEWRLQFKAVDEDSSFDFVECILQAAVEAGVDFDDSGFYHIIITPKED